MAEFFRCHHRNTIVLHHAAFDLSVIDLLSPLLDIYSWVDRRQVWDTELLHRLLVLGTAGHTASNKGQSTLDHCAERYLGITLAKDVVNGKGQPVRLSFGQWLNCPLNDVEPIYLEYLGKDALVTHELFQALEEKHEQLESASRDAWGFISRKYLFEQQRRWGWQTHHIQLQAAIVLGRLRPTD